MRSDNDGCLEPDEGMAAWVAEKTKYWSHPVLWSKLGPARREIWRRRRAMLLASIAREHLIERLEQATARREGLLDV